MGELVNLRQVKKQQEKAAKAALADANRRLHGRTKTEKAADAAAKAQAEKTLDQARLDK